MKRHITKRGLLKWDVAAALLLVLGICLAWRGIGQYSLLPSSETELINPYLAQADPLGNVWVIDDERARVVKIGRSGRVEYWLKSTAREADAFSYAEDLAFGHDGAVYVLDASWDESGFAVGRECILAYDADGKYTDTLLDLTYQDEGIDKHRLFALTFWEGALYYVESGQEGFSLHCVSIGTKAERTVASWAYPDAFNLIQDYAFSPENGAVYALDKRGRILKGCGGELTLLYDTAEDPQYVGLTALYRIAVGSGQKLYLTDIRQDRMYQFEEGWQSMEAWMQGCALSVTTAAQEDGGELLGTLSESGILIKDLKTGEETQGAVFPKDASLRLTEAVCQIAAVIAALAALWLFIRMLALLSGIRLSEIQKNGILAAGTAAVVVVVIVSQLFRQFSEIYLEELMRKIDILAYTVSGMVDGESLEQIQACEDYMGEDYQELMRVLNLGMNRKGNSARELYCNVLRYEDGQGYAVAYLDNSIGVYYPQDEEETAELAKVYETKTALRNDGKDNETGSYVYVRVPILDKEGEVAGVLEIGSTTSVMLGKVAEMKRSVMIMLVLALLIVLLLFGETLSFFDLRNRHREERKAGRQSMPLHTLRLSIFITFMAFNMASSFLPVYAAGFVTEGLGLPKELAASLPITLNMIFVGLMSLFCARLVERFSFRAVAAASAFASMAGDALLFLCQGYYAIVLGLILNGIGMGLITNSINMFIAGSSQDEVRKEGFSLLNAGSLSGVNCGMMFGASLAGALGQRTVFCCSAFAWLLTAVLFFLMGKHMDRAEEGNAEEKNTGAFLISRGVVPYLLLIQFPYMVINSFVFYYVPIYGAKQGLSENIVCLLLMLNSLCSVYLSVAMTDFASRKFGEKSIYLSSALSFAGLLLFGWNSSIPVLVVVLLILGLASSFGSSVRQLYFTELPGVEEYGEEHAMGIYSFMDSVGESTGPLIFGSMMSGFALLPGLVGFVAISGALNGLYACLFGKKRDAG